MSRKNMPRDHRPLKNNFERYHRPQHSLGDATPHQAVLEANTVKSQASTFEKIAIGATVLSLAISMSVLGVPAETEHAVSSPIEQSL